MADTGWSGKGQDFSQLQQVVSEQCAGLLVLGQAAAEITDQLDVRRGSSKSILLRRRCSRVSVGTIRRHSIAVASMCQFGYVQQLRRAWRTIPVRRSGAGGGVVMGVGRAGSQHGDTVLLTLGTTLISIGVIAIASASIEYGDFHFGNPWHHTQRHAAYLMLAITLGALAYMAPAASVQAAPPGYFPCYCLAHFGDDSGYWPRG